MSSVRDPGRPIDDGSETRVRHPEYFSCTGPLRSSRNPEGIGVGPVSSLRTVPSVQILAIVILVGAIAVGAYKLYIPKVSDESGTSVKPEAEPPGM